MAERKPISVLRFSTRHAPGFYSQPLLQKKDPAPRATGSVPASPTPRQIIRNVEQESPGDYGRVTPASMANAPRFGTVQQGPPLAFSALPPPAGLVAGAGRAISGLSNVAAVREAGGETSPLDYIKALAGRGYGNPETARATITSLQRPASDKLAASLPVSEPTPAAPGLRSPLYQAASFVSPERPAIEQDILKENITPGAGQEGIIDPGKLPPSVPSPAPRPTPVYGGGQEERLGTPTGQIPTPREKPEPPQRSVAPHAGLAGGGLIDGPGGPTEDRIPGTVGGVTPVRLSDGEFVIRNSVVRRLGGGSEDAGAQLLERFMDAVDRGEGGLDGMMQRIQGPARRTRTAKRNTARSDPDDRGGIPPFTRMPMPTDAKAPLPPIRPAPKSRLRTVTVTATEKHDTNTRAMWPRVEAPASQHRATQKSIVQPETGTEITVVRSPRPLGPKPGGFREMDNKGLVI